MSMTFFKQQIHMYGCVCITYSTCVYVCVYRSVESVCVCVSLCVCVCHCVCACTSCPCEDWKKGMRDFHRMCECSVKR